MSARRAVVEVLREQNRGFGADAATERSLERLAKGAVAIVTGQQVGLFSGPAYSFYKALTAIRWAEKLTGRGIDAVPVFWLATEDHDLAEVNQCFWLTKSGTERFSIAEAEKFAGRQVGEIKFGNEISGVVDTAVRGLGGAVYGGGRAGAAGIVCEWRIIWIGVWEIVRAGCLAGAG